MNAVMQAAKPLDGSRIHLRKGLGHAEDTLKTRRVHFTLGANFRTETLPSRPAAGKDMSVA